MSTRTGLPTRAMCARARIAGAAAGKSSQVPKSLSWARLNVCVFNRMMRSEFAWPKQACKSYGIIAGSASGSRPCPSWDADHIGGRAGGPGDMFWELEFTAMYLFVSQGRVNVIVCLFHPSENVLRTCRLSGILKCTDKASAFRIGGPVCSIGCGYVACDCSGSNRIRASLLMQTRIPQRLQSLNRRRTQRTVLPSPPRRSRRWRWSRETPPLLRACVLNWIDDAVDTQFRR